MKKKLSICEVLNNIYEQFVLYCSHGWLLFFTHKGLTNSSKHIVLFYDLFTLHKTYL